MNDADNMLSISVCGGVTNVSSRYQYCINDILITTLSFQLVSNVSKKGTTYNFEVETLSISTSSYASIDDGVKSITFS